MRKRDFVDVLSGVWLFSACTRKELTALASLATQIDVPAGKALVTREQRRGQVVDGKHGGDVDQPARKRRCRDEHAGDEVERQHHRLRDRLGRVLVADHRRERVAEATEREGPDHDGDDEGRGGAQRERARRSAAQPIASSITVMARAVDHRRERAPERSSPSADTGVARRRFSTPDSRCAVTEMTRLMNDAAMIPRVMMPGT